MILESSLFISFLLISAGLIIIPGPNVLVIVSAAVTQGKKRALRTVAGTTTAMALQMTIAAAGTAWFIRALADGLYFLKWAGAVYLFYLGARQILRIFAAQKATGEPAPVSRAGASFGRGFFVSLTNPKTILFFGAFLPQFTSASGDYGAQIALLSATFLMLAAALDTAYALAAARLGPLLERRRSAALPEAISGLLYLGAGAWLALTRRA